FQSPILDADLCCLFSFEEVECDVTQQSKVLGRVIFADAAIILTEGNIKNPVNTILYLGLIRFCGHFSKGRSTVEGAPARAHPVGGSRTVVCLVPSGYSPQPKHRLL